MSEQTVYACKRYPGFQFRVGEKRFRFQNHQLIVTNPEDVKLIDDACAEYPQIGAKVKKVSLEQAEALVSAHIASRGGAAKGPFTAAHGNQGDLATIKNRDAALANMSLEQENDLRDKLAEDSALMTTVEEIPKPAAAETSKPAIALKPKTSVKS